MEGFPRVFFAFVLEEVFFSRGFLAYVFFYFRGGGGGEGILGFLGTLKAVLRVSGFRVCRDPTSRIP